MGFKEGGGSKGIDASKASKGAGGKEPPAMAEKCYVPAVSGSGSRRSDKEGCRLAGQVPGFKPAKLSSAGLAQQTPEVR